MGRCLLNTVTIAIGFAFASGCTPRDVAESPPAVLDVANTAVASTSSAPSPPAPSPASAPADAQSRLLIDAIAVPEKSSAEVTVVARLVWMPQGVHCGVLHVATVMQYEIVSVESGKLDGKAVFVAHGCPELPRAQYGKGAGTLKAFRIGELHRMVLSTKLPADGPTIMQEPALPTFFCKTVDPAA